MKTTPILFSTPMVQAILAGTKNQTRRIVKDKLLQTNTNEFEEEEFLLLTTKDSPYGSVGDILWVRETFHKIKHNYFIYKANHDHQAMKWKPSIFMPKEACRIFLKITSVRAERLQKISGEDAINEGIEVIHNSTVAVYQKYNLKEKLGTTNPILSYQTLWEKINGAESWNTNPFVWVIEFERVEKPENFV